MELVPEMELTFNGGWLFLITFYLLQFYNVTFIDKKIRERLFDRSNFSTKQWLLTLLGKIFAIIAMIMMALTSIDQDLVTLIIGLLLYFLGMIGLRIATLNFINTPFDKPVTEGLYKYSRNPQESMVTIILAGIGVMVGSWTILGLLLLSRVFNHCQILAQEEACLKEYGENYSRYSEEVPRYLWKF